MWLLNNYKEKQKEKKVLERYKQLAGLVRDGRMVNPDKESRARQWVKEQEEQVRQNKTSKEWYERPLGILFLGIVASFLIAFVFYFLQK